MVHTPDEAAKLDLGEVHSWISLLHGDSQGLISATAINGGRTASTFFPPDQIEENLNWFTSFDGDTWGIYLRCTTVKVHPVEGRGSADISYSVPGFWCDMDLAGPGHKPPAGSTLPPDLRACKQIITESGLPQPSLWIHSGGGLYPWWLFQQPLNIESIEGIAHVTSLSKRWHEAISEGAKKLDLHVAPTTYNLDRVLRIPGTINRKVPDLPRPCHVLEASGGYFTSEDVEVVLADALKVPEPVRPVIPQQRHTTPVTSGGSGVTPLDDFEARTPWEDILTPHGWQVCRIQGRTWYWTRPGKAEGISATTGHEADRDRLYVFSDATDFQANTPITKGYAYAVLNHGGDVSAAASELRRRGFGDQTTMTAPRSPWDGVATPTVPASTVNSSVPTTPISTPPLTLRQYEDSDEGSAQRLVDNYGDTIGFSQNRGGWLCYDWAKHIWYAPNAKQCLVGKVVKTLTDAADEECGFYNDVPVRPGVKSDQDRFRDFLKKSKSSRTVNSILDLAASKVIYDAEEFDSHRNLFNMGAKTLNTDTMAVLDSVPAHMETRVGGVEYNPEATAPTWQRFLERNLPDVEVRTLLQKAVGYALTGKSNQKALFYLYGQPDTGKSLFVDVVSRLFGGYGWTAEEGTFSPSDRGGGGASPHLVKMRGKRFVSASESKPGQVVDEALIKRVTGGDEITGRALYRDSESFTPECVIFVASNHHLRVVGGDEAVWSRVKVVEFPVQFPAGHPDRDENLKDKLLAELPGILNWAIEGLRQFNADGGSLSYPESVVAQTRAVADSQDGVRQFVAELVAQRKMALDVEGASTRKTKIWAAYRNWYVEQEGTDRWMVKSTTFYERFVRVTNVEAGTKDGYQVFKGVMIAQGAGM